VKKLFAKGILLALVVALAILVALPMTAMAADPTTTTVTWTGGGVIGGTVTSGNDNVTTFGVNAAGANGSFTVTDNNDNPYSYGVDTVSAYIQSNVTNGSTFFQTNRTDSKTSMYGAAGQTVYAFVGSNGTGAMATGSGTNYASMGNGTYAQPHTAGGFNFEANAGAGTYQIIQSVTAVDALAQFVANGTGTAKIDCMTTGASGATNVNFGYGGGCYTNADALFTGAGSFGTYAEGSNSITTPSAGGWTANGVSTLQTIMNFTTGASVNDFSIKVQ
jgi:hypothetical protein